MSQDQPCTGCQVVSGERVPPGGVLWRGEGFLFHAVVGPTPVRGWMVLTSERHCRAFYALSGAEAAAMGRWSAEFARRMMDRLGAQHVYLFGIGDLLEHCHVHLVPRYADTPEHYRGRGVFDLRQPSDALSGEEAATAARRLRDARSE